MSGKEIFELVVPDAKTPAVRIDRRNGTCDMRAWYFQTPTNTFAFAKLNGAHGERKDIPADRKYYVLAGEGQFTINGNVQKVAKGAIVLISKGSTYDFCSTSVEALEVFVDIGIPLDLDKIPSK